MAHRRPTATSREARPDAIDIAKERTGENMVLSNRDKSQHTKSRGMDGRAIETEQLQDHSANRLTHANPRRRPS